jgi:hypothetical protein
MPNHIVILYSGKYNTDRGRRAPEFSVFSSFECAMITLGAPSRIFTQRTCSRRGMTNYSDYHIGEAPKNHEVAFAVMAKCLVRPCD